MTSVRLAASTLLIIVCTATLCLGQYGVKIAGCHDFDGYVPLVERICFSDVNEVYKIRADVPFGRVGESPASINWSGPNISQMGYDTINNQLYPYAFFKTATPATIEVQWRTYSVDPEGNQVVVCRRGYTLLEISHPKPPKIILDKPMIKAGEYATMTAKPGTACDAGPCLTEWGIKGCNSISWQGADGSHTFAWRMQEHTKFVARSKNPTGCNSEIDSVNAAVINFTPCPTIAQDEYMKFIDKEANNISRGDYHYYTRESVVCDKTDPGCSAESVFHRLLADVNNNVPNGDDIEACLEPWERFGFAHSKSLFPPGDPALPIPITHCQEASIPRPDWLVQKTAFFSSLICESFEVSDSGADPVFVSVDQSSRCVTNYTMPGHTFYPGKVTRCVKEDQCKIYIVTIGVGTTGAGDNICGRKLAKLNAEKGQCIFSEVDKRFISNLKLK